MRIVGLRWVLVGLGFLAAIFHLWYAAAMPVLSSIGEYFYVAGVLFLVGGALVAIRGKGFLFQIGAWGLIALSVIDNGLLYYTRTYGMGVLAGLVFAARNRLGNSTRPVINSTIPRPPFNGTARFTPPPGGFGRGLPWSTSWSPPGSVQFFVLQSVIIVVAVATILIVWKTRRSETNSPAQSPKL